MFKQKTAYEMRISDWSSDVCSSDLDGDGKAQPQHRLGGPSRLWTSGVGTVFTGRFRLDIDMPEAVAEQRERYACDIGLVRLESRQVGDPRAGNSENNQQYGDDAASRGEPRAGQCARHQPVCLLRLVVLGEGWLARFRGRKRTRLNYS